MLQIDEFRAWVGLLQVTEGIMPCPLCRQHYKTWKAKHPPEAILSLGGRGGPTGREEARRFVWELHNTVNAEKGYPTFPFEELEEVYGSPARTRQAFQEDIDALLKVLADASLQRLIDATHVRTWKGRLGLLRTLIGF